jgi:hypothetical protein
MKKILGKIKENLGKILFFVSFGAILFIISINANYDVDANKQQQRIQYVKDSLETEYYKKELESYPYNHSEIKDTTKKVICPQNQKSVKRNSMKQF